jgi:hypothetical protein
LQSIWWLHATPTRPKGIPMAVKKIRFTQCWICMQPWRCKASDDLCATCRWQKVIHHGFSFSLFWYGFIFWRRWMFELNQFDSFEQQ